VTADGSATVASSTVIGATGSGTMVRVPRPIVPAGSRRVGIQAGHWRMAEVPDELRRLVGQTGTSAGGVAEWQVNLDIANRVASILREDGITVDVIPATVPEGYLADAFLSLHADGDLSGTRQGFKAAHGTRRGPYEPQLVRAIVEEYGRATGLLSNGEVSRNMTGYYAFGWSRFRSSVAPHTPAAILEMGYLTHAGDRAVLTGQAMRVADGVARGLRRFLADVPAGVAFAEDLLLPPAPAWGRRPAG
jgi:N-acetylmuramoyl-L-alanine amidase